MQDSEGIQRQKGRKTQTAENLLLMAVFCCDVSCIGLLAQLMPLLQSLPKHPGQENCHLIWRPVQTGHISQQGLWRQRIYHQRVEVREKETKQDSVSRLIEAFGIKPFSLVLRDNSGTSGMFLFHWLHGTMSVVLLWFASTFLLISSLQLSCILSHKSFTSQFFCTQHGSDTRNWKIVDQILAVWEFLHV